MISNWKNRLEHKYKMAISPSYLVSYYFNKIGYDFKKTLNNTDEKLKKRIKEFVKTLN